MEDECTCKDCEDKLYIRSEAYKKWAWNLHEFLKEKVKQNRSYYTCHQNTEHSESSEIFDWIYAGSIFICPKSEWSNKSANHSSDKKFARAKMILLRKYKISTIWEHRENDVKISEEWSYLNTVRVYLWKDKDDARTRESNYESYNFSFCYSFIEKKIRTNKNKYWSKEINHLCNTDVCQFNTIGVEDAIYSYSHTNNYELNNMFPWIFTQFRDKGWDYDESYQISEDCE